MSDEPQLPLQMQALLNRLQARFGSSVADAAATLLATAEGAPARLSREWQLFWQEVELETERLASAQDPIADAEAFSAEAPGPSPAGAGPSSHDPQELIDNLRARVAALSHSLDA